MLEVAYERAVRHIAADVVERPRGSLFLAVGRSGEVRAEVESAFVERGIAVASAKLRDDEGPWWRILETHKQSGRPASELILSIAGLGDMAGDKLDRILEHLNLGRELRVVNRLHVLLWVGGLDNLECFRTGASDLWGHRSGVELFLSSKDFEVAVKDLEPGEAPKSLETLLSETEAELALSPKPARRIALLSYKAMYLLDLGRASEGLRTVEYAERVLAERGMSARERADAHARIVQWKLATLLNLGRTEEALQYATGLEQDAESDPILRYGVSRRLARLHMDAGRVAESLGRIAMQLDLGPTLPILLFCGQGRDLISRADLYARLGALDAAIQNAVAAAEEAERLRGRSDQDDGHRPTLLSQVDAVLATARLERGDTLDALAYAHHDATRIVDLGATRFTRKAFESLADMYRRLGLFGDARRFARRAIHLLESTPGEVAWWTRWLGVLDADERQLDAAIALYESSIALYRAAADAERGPHRRATWLRDAASVLHDDLAPLTDGAHCFQQAEDLLTRAAQAADEAASPEQHALTQRSRAALARAAKQWDRAETELLTVLTYAEANWGPYKRASVLLNLALVARERGDLPRAAEHAERAQREVAIDPPEYRNRYVAIDAARELARIRKAQGDIPSAHAALEAALAITQGDNLRLREREVRLDLAELPPPPGGPDRRLEHAARARTIAQDAAFPVDEAEAILVLAELHLDGGHERRARSMFEQAVWIVDRIGPRPVRERAARLRDKLGG